MIQVLSGAGQCLGLLTVRGSTGDLRALSIFCGTFPMLSRFTIRDILILRGHYNRIDMGINIIRTMRFYGFTMITMRRIRHDPGIIFVTNCTTLFHGILYLFRHPIATLNTIDVCRTITPFFHFVINRILAQRLSQTTIYATAFMLSEPFVPITILQRTSL